MHNIGEIKNKVYRTDILIIGGGNAGCFAGIEAKKQAPALDVLIMEKANIKRSGCLAGGMDAINSYIKKGKTPEDFVRWSRAQVGGLLREDLSLSMARLINKPINDWEDWGLPIKHTTDTRDYVARGKWDITISGSEMKPILAQKTVKMGVKILNRVVATNFIVTDGLVQGAYGFGVRDGKFYIIQAKAVIIATGGAAGLYKPYQGDTTGHHQLWYCPYNVGTGYAMGIRSGAEMTSFEMRWCAVRTKDFNGPIDTVSQGYKTPMINCLGEKILAEKYAEMGGDNSPRYIRANVPMEEWLQGRGPCYVDTTHMTEQQIKDMKTDYLNERPSFVLFLAAHGQDISKKPIEVYGSDPYIVGGHTASGYWVDVNRATTLSGLFACGDVAGGTPNKFVGGCAAEGIIAARSAIKFCRTVQNLKLVIEEQYSKEKSRIYRPLFRYQDGKDGICPCDMEERLQRLMDEYAGGVHQFFRMNEHQLTYALEEIQNLKEQVKFLLGDSFHGLMLAHEVIDRIDVAEVLVHHLLFRKETRWPGWQTRSDFPEKNDEKFDCFVNSFLDIETGKIKMVTRPYVQIIPGNRSKA